MYNLLLVLHYFVFFHLVPATETVGHLLCSGLFSMDTLSKWFAAVALSHALVDNPTQKEQLLRVQLATRMGSPAISLMNQCSQMLQQVKSLLIIYLYLVIN